MATVTAMDGDAADQDAVGYLSPPVSEVAIGIQIDPVQGLGGIASGDLWRAWQERYPHIQEQPPLPPMPPIGQAGGIWFQIGQSAGVRTWFLDGSQDHVIQLQADRVIVNWRNVSGAPYPRYEKVRARFERAWQDVVRFARGENGVAGSFVVVRQVELNYINTITASPREAITGAQELFGNVDDSVQMGAQYEVPISDEVWEAAVRNVNFGMSAPTSTQLTISVRGVPADVTNPFPALDRSHDEVLRTFNQVTTASMQQEWRRETR